MGRTKVAIPTKADRGLEDFVSDVFGRAEFFAILEVTNGSTINVEVVRNPAASYKHGAGPLVVKMLSDKGVTAVAGREFGLGASTLLEHNNIKKVTVKANTAVKEAVQKILKELQEEACV